MEVLQSMNMQKQSHTHNPKQQLDSANPVCYRKWLSFTLAAVLILLVLIGGLTAAVDPYFHYHKPLKGLAYPIDDERYQNDGISRHFDYNAIITGSSVTENFKASQFDQLFNASSIKIPFAGGYYKEIDQAVKRALAYNPNVTQVLRGLDGYFLIQDKDFWNPDAPNPQYLYDKNPFSDVKYLFNKDILINDVFPVLRSFFDSSQGRTTTFDEYMNWAPEREWGMEAVQKTYERTPKSDEIHPLSEEDRQIIIDNIEQNVLQTARANPQVTFYCFYPPYSICFWDDELHQRGLMERYLDAQKLAAELLLSCDNIRLFAFDDEFDMVCNMDNYMDVIHYSEEINGQILNWIANGKHELTGENLDSYFQAIEDFYTAYDYDSLYEAVQ